MRTLFNLLLLIVCIETSLFSEFAHSDETPNRAFNSAEMNAQVAAIRQMLLPLEYFAYFDIPPELPCPEKFGSLIVEKNAISLVLPASAMTHLNWRNVMNLPLQATNVWRLQSPTCWVSIEAKINTFERGAWKAVPVTHFKPLINKAFDSSNPARSQAMNDELTPAQIEAVEAIGRLRRWPFPLEFSALFDVPPERSCPDLAGSLGFYRSSLSLILPASAISSAAYGSAQNIAQADTNVWQFESNTCQVVLTIGLKVFVNGNWTTVAVSHKSE